MDKENFYTGDPVYTGELSKDEVCSIANIAGSHYSMQNAINTPLQYRDYNPIENIIIDYGNKTEKPAFCYENNAADKEKQEKYVVPGFIFEDGHQDEKESFDPVNEDMMFPGYLYEKRKFTKATFDYNDPDSYKDLSHKRYSSTNQNNQQQNVYMNQPTLQTGSGYGLGSSNLVDERGIMMFAGNPALAAGYKPNGNVNCNLNNVKDNSGITQVSSQVYIPPYNPLGINSLLPSNLDSIKTDLYMKLSKEKAEAEAKEIARISRLRRSGAFNTLSANGNNYYGQPQTNQFVYKVDTKEFEKIESEAKSNALNLSMNLSKLAHNYLKDGVSEKDIKDIYLGKYINVKDTVYEMTDFDILEKRAKNWIPVEISPETKKYRNDYDEQRRNIEKILPANTRAEDFGMFASELNARWEAEETKSKNRSLSDQYNHSDYQRLLQSRILEEYSDTEDISPIKVKRVLDQQDIGRQAQEILNGLYNAFSNAENRYPNAMVPFRMVDRAIERRRNEFKNYIKNIVVNCLEPTFKNYEPILYSFDIDNAGNIIGPDINYIYNLLSQQRNVISQEINTNENQYNIKKKNFDAATKAEGFYEFIESYPKLDDPINRNAANKVKNEYLMSILNGEAADDPLAKFILNSRCSHYSLSDDTKKEKDEDTNSPPNNDGGE